MKSGDPKSVQGVNRSIVVLGFTIVELLVVIVVIGVLAAITVVSYTGISQKAVISSLQSDLINASKLLKMDQITNMSFPSTLASVNDGKGIPNTDGTSYQYFVNNDISPQSFCISATKAGIVYRITEIEKPVLGDCEDFGLIQFLDAGDSASYPEPKNGTTWNDLSSYINNGSLLGGVAYSSDGEGTMNFDGIDDYINVPSSVSLKQIGAITVDAWVKPNLQSTREFVATKWPGFTMEINTSNIVTCGVQINGVQYMALTSNALLNNTWVNISLTYSASSRTVSTYINGDQEIKLNSLSGSLPQYSMNIGDGPLGIGKYSTFFWNGSISRVRIYNRELKSDEILQNFNSLRGRYGI